MKQKIEQLNQSYKKALGAVLQHEYPQEGVLVDDVLLDPSMQHGRAWLICTPEQLKNIRERRGVIQRMVQTKLTTRYTPKIDFLLKDDYLEKVDQLFERVEKEHGED